MTDGIYAALSGAVAAERALDVVANNVANVGTSGFRAQRATFRESLSSATSAAPRSLRYTELDETRLDRTTGPLRATGNALDLAIAGDAYFVVDGPSGPRFTRDGSFLIGADGVLRTSRGLPVRAEGPLDGTPRSLVVTPGTTQVSVGPDGTLSTGDAILGRLAVVRVDDQELRPEGGALFAARRPQAAVPATGVEILSGVVEGANVAPITGMNELIVSSRTFEAFQRAIQTFRGIDERTARDLARA
jgi:flagellar basal-body rod protein FlgF